MTATHNTSKQNSHKPYKNYTQVAFQQGKPVLDYELNDAQSVVLQQITSHLQTLEQFCGIETSPSEFALVPLSFADRGKNDRNINNFGITLGRLPTKFGVIDTTHLKQVGKNDIIAFDKQRLDDLELSTIQDHGYENYLFKGKITAIPQANQITDEHKDFSREYLDLTQSTRAFQLSHSDTDSITLNLLTNGADIVFTNCANSALNGTRKLIATISSSNTIQFLGNLALTVGDEYVIVPRNNFASIKSSFDNEVDTMLTIGGTQANPIVITYVQSFIEDIASQEDDEIKLAQIGMETSHRKQLRWCVRTARVFLSSTDIEKLLLIDDQIVGVHSKYSRELLGAYTPFEQPVDTLLDTFLGTQAELLENGDLKTQLATQVVPINLSVDGLEFPEIVGTYSNVYQTKGISSQSFFVKNRASVLSVKTLKAVLLQALQGNTSLDLNDALGSEFDISILQVHSAPSKRIGNSAQRNDTLSPYFYAGYILEKPVDDTVAIAIPMFKAFKLISNSSNFVVLLNGYFYQPPRIFQSQSEISTELLQAKSMTYSLGYMPESDDFISCVLPFSNNTDFQPFTYRSIIQRSSLSGGTPIAFETLGQKLAFNDISAIAMLGIGSAYSIRHNAVIDLASTLPTMSATGFGSTRIDVGFAGQLSDVSKSETELVGLNAFKNGIFGGIVFSNPILTGDLNSIVNQVQNVEGSNVGYYVPKAIVNDQNVNTHFVNYSDKQFGYSPYKDEQTLRMREFENGILQASVFANTFNLRKLAVKTQASLEADLFTLDVPHTFDTFKNRSIEESVDAQLLANVSVLYSGNPDNAPSIRNSISNLGNVVLENRFGQNYFGSPIKSFVANSKTSGDLNQSTGSIYPRIETGIRFSNPSAFNTNDILKGIINPSLFGMEITEPNGDFTSLISVTYPKNGGVDIESEKFQKDRSFLTDEQALELPDTLLDHELGAWAIKRIARTSFDSASALDKRKSLSTFTNRNTSASLRYHVGDFYPGQADARGIPRNLLVDSLNLYVKLEPLPLVHWYTMPKHQHSVLEGSLDVSEAIATLLDITHARGIPDHLFNLGKQFTTKHKSNALDNTVIDQARLNVEHLLDPAISNTNTSFDPANLETSGFEIFNESGTNSQNSNTFKIITSWLGSTFGHTLPAYNLDKSTTLNNDEKEAIRLNTATNGLLEYMSSSNGKLNLGDIDPIGISLPNHAQPFIHWYHPNMDNIKSNAVTITKADSTFTIPEMSMYSKWGRRSLVIPALVPMENSNHITKSMFGGLYQTNPIGEYSTSIVSGASTDNSGILTDENVTIKADVFDLVAGSNGALRMITLAEGSDLLTIAGYQLPLETDAISDQISAFPHHSSGLNGKFILADRVTSAQNGGLQNVNYFNKFPMILNTTRVKAQETTFDNNLYSQIREILTQSGAPRPVYLPSSAYFYDNPVVNTDHNQTIANETINAGRLDPTRVGMGFHPAINWIGYDFSTIKTNLTNVTFDPSNKKDFDLRSFPTDEDQIIYEPAIRDANINAPISSWSGLLGSETAWSTPAMRACISTDTLAYLNLMIKTYTFIPGHDSIHPYDDLSAFNQSKIAPKWIQDTLSSGLDKVPGKAVATNTDTEYVGSMGTNMHTTGASLFIDELLFGSTYAFDGNSFFKKGGSHRDTEIVRDLFEVATKKIILALANQDTEQIALKYTPIINAFSKGSMQTKLLYNCSLRVLHSRPNSSKIGQATAPRSLTEMFLCVDGENNRLIKLPRTTLNKAEYKPYIHVQGISKTLNHDYIAGGLDHPNHKFMQHLDSMISDTLGIGQSFDTATPYITEQTNAYKNAIPLADFIEVDPCSCVGEPLKQTTSQNYITARNGDTFNADPFDFAYDRSTTSAITASNAKSINPMISASSSNSGVEYELLSCLSAIHEKANDIGINSNIGKAYNGTPYTLQDLIPTANELTLPGDHEITFVLYTGKHGQMYAEDMTEVFNPNVAGCHIKATIEINRPTQYISSSEVENVHYGKTIDGQPIQTYRIAGGNPNILTDMTVFDPNA